MWVEEVRVYFVLSYPIWSDIRNVKRGPNDCFHSEKRHGFYAAVNVRSLLLYIYIYKRFTIDRPASKPCNCFFELHWRCCRCALLLLLLLLRAADFAFFFSLLALLFFSLSAVVCFESHKKYWFFLLLRTYLSFIPLT